MTRGWPHSREYHLWRLVDHAHHPFPEQLLNSGEIWPMSIVHLFFTTQIFLAPQNIQCFDYVNKTLLSYFVAKFMLQFHCRCLKCFKYNLESNDSWVYTIVGNNTHWKKKRKTSNYTTYLPTDIMQSLKATIMIPNPISRIFFFFIMNLPKTKWKLLYTKIPFTLFQTEGIFCWTQCKLLCSVVPFSCSQGFLKIYKAWEWKSFTILSHER